MEGFLTFDAISPPPGATHATYGGGQLDLTLTDPATGFTYSLSSDNPTLTAILGAVQDQFYLNAAFDSDPIFHYLNLVTCYYHPPLGTEPTMEIDYTIKPPPVPWGVGCYEPGILSAGINTQLIIGFGQVSVVSEPSSMSLFFLALSAFGLARNRAMDRGIQKSSHTQRR